VKDIDLSAMFTAEPAFVGHAGFGLFTASHILWIVLSCAMVCVVVAAYRSLPEGTQAHGARHKLLLACSITALAFLVSQDALIVAQPTPFAPNWWPLHICNMSAYAAFGYALKPNRFCGNLLYAFGIIGGLLGILFPAWNYCPALCWATIGGFVQHAMPLAVAVSLLSTGDFRPKRRDMWMPMAFLLVYALLIMPFNAAFGANFAFLSHPVLGTPLEWAAVQFGNPGYQIPYAAIILAIVAALYVPWRNSRC